MARTHRDHAGAQYTAIRHGRQDGRTIRPGLAAIDGAGFSTYLWSPGGETTQLVTVSSEVTTTYTVTVTTVWGCLGQDSHTVTVVISQDEIFADGFESGDTTAWSS